MRVDLPRLSEQLLHEGVSLSAEEHAAGHDARDCDNYNQYVRVLAGCIRDKLLRELVTTGGRVGPATKETLHI